MAAAYIVTLPDSVVAAQLQDGIDCVIVHANDATDAKAMAKAAMGADSNVLWDLATATAIVAATNWIGFRFVITETYPNGSIGVTADLTATGAGQDTIDEIGAALATALGGGAAYNSTTQVLLLDTATRGANSLEVKVYPPAGSGQDAPIPGIVASISHRGAAADDLSVTFAADAFSLPALYGKCRLRRS